MTLEEKSYIFGLLGTDGNLSLYERNRGKISLEVQIRDKDICEKLFNLVPNSSITERERDTNFKQGYHSVTFTNHQLSFRQMLLDYGFPEKDKTNNFTVPNSEYSERDFWRGVIDGDGSLGFCQDGSPFLSLTTKSENLKEEYCKLLLKFGIEKNINRNKRDNIYNIMIKNEDALNVIHYLYDNCELYLERKYQKALETYGWVRTKPKAAPRKKWTPEQDEYILSHTIEESMKYLDRTKNSIEMRLYRLRQSNNN